MAMPVSRQLRRCPPTKMDHGLILRSSRGRETPTSLRAENNKLSLVTSIFTKPWRSWVVLVLVCFLRQSVLSAPPRAALGPPAPVREFRGVWISTFENVDWPSKPGLTSKEQISELVAIIDRAARMNL